MIRHFLETSRITRGNMCACKIDLGIPLPIYHDKDEQVTSVDLKTQKEVVTVT
ncbi:MAG: hypothetical protein AAGA18_11210 [Verrucomicrobiota bacterium]